MNNKNNLLEIRKPINRSTSIYLGISIWVIFFGFWQLSCSMGWVNSLLVPSPLKVLEALKELLFERGFLEDIIHSILRVIVSFFLACTIAIPLGILMGSFRSIESFFNPFVSAWRYLPAPSFIPVLLMWFGTGETPKLALLFIGVVFFLITMVMDYTRNIKMALRYLREFTREGEEDVLDGGRRPRAQRTVRPWARLFNGAITDGARLLKLVALVTHKIRFERWFTASYAQNQWTTPWMMSRPAKIFADGCPSG